MKLKCKARDIHSAIDAAMKRDQNGRPIHRDIRQNPVDGLWYTNVATWTEFDAERGIWIEKTSDEFFGDSITKLNELAGKATCPECEGYLSEAGRCWNCEPEVGS